MEVCLLKMLRGMWLLALIRWLEWHLGGRFFPFFSCDTFNVVGFHLFIFYLMFARPLPQIQMPLTSVMNEKTKGVEKSFPLIRQEKNFLRGSQIFHYILLAQTGSYDHLQRKGQKSIWIRRSNMKGLEKS